MAPKAYSVKNLVVTFGSKQLKGWGPDGAVKTASDIETNKLVTGLGSDSVWVHDPRTTGTVTLTLMATSDDSDYLAGWLKTDRLAGGILDEPVLVVDLTTGRKWYSPAAKVQKLPETASGLEPGTEDWVFVCSDLDRVTNSAG